MPRFDRNAAAAQGWSWSLQLVVHGLRHALRCHSGHAVVVAKWALPFEARAARNVVANHRVLRTEWACQNGLGGTEDGDRGHAERGRQMHGAGVIGDESAAAAQGLDESSE